MSLHWSAALTALSLSLFTVTAVATPVLQPERPAASLLSNGDFDQSNVERGSYRYAPGIFDQAVAASGWTFSNHAGIAHESADWGGVASRGTVAFLQDYGPARSGTPTMSQSFDSTSSAFWVAFDLAQRWDATESVQVWLDGVLLGGTLLTPPGQSWTTYGFEVSGLTGSRHTLTFEGLTAFRSADSSVFIDNVRVGEIPEAGSIALVAAAMGALWLAGGRRRT